MPAVITSVVTTPPHAPKYISTHSFPMGSAQVNYCQEIGGSHAVLTRRGLDAVPEDKSKTNPTSTVPGPIAPPSGKPFDLTPAKCGHPTCYAGTFQKPSLEDCEMVIQAQLYNSTGSLEAAPGISAMPRSNLGLCVLRNLCYRFPFNSSIPKNFISQNPEEASSTLQYNWAELGAQAGKIAGKCSLDEDKSMGGSCTFGKYLKYNFDNIMITLQRFDDRDIQNAK
ncbi:hypothetical protein PSTT_09654 [Puccinia striiformis]|uniref:Uncharacterized protein n=1 Tax=Puccinia striiformis TaxID=27350 RepID=A0A2S4V7I3_9BASI|nr:hypothetical protein PSTT_09654 [Puccinia striiformis]